MGMEIDSPLLKVFENDGQIQTHLYPGERDYKEYAIHIAALVRYVAKALDVSENGVWEPVDEERYHPTTPVSELKPN
ncbi:MAG: hypothetical protein WBQ95_15740 [Terracidiphilus sp.]